MARRVVIDPVIAGGRSRGRLQVYYDTKREKYVAQGWPKGNGGDTPKRAAARAEFKNAVAIIKLGADLDVAAAYASAKNTRFLPRDLLMKAAYGNMMQFSDKSQQVYTGVRIMQADIQALLKSIGSIDGSILVVVDGDWYALSPGAANEVLTIDATTGLPQWEATSSGAAGNNLMGWSPNFSTTLYTAGGACKGNVLKAVKDIEISTIVVRYNRASTTPITELTCGLYEVDEATYAIASIIAETAQLTVPAVNGDYTDTLDLTGGKVTIPAGTTFAICMRRTDGTDTSNWGSYVDATSHNNPLIGYPITDIINGSTTSHFGVTLAKAAPAIGDTFSTFGYNVQIGVYDAG